jgi:hypothetical protein
MDKKLSVGLGQVFTNIAFGASLQHLNGTKNFQAVKGTTFGLGLATMFTPKLRLGASYENLGNTHLKDFAPQTLRLGGAYLLLDGSTTIHLDYRQRQRTSAEATHALDLSNPNSKATTLDEEKMLIGSFSVKFQDLLRLMGGYSQTILGPQRTTLSGGIALVNKNLTLSYLVSNPDLQNSNLNQTLHMALGLEM